MSSAFPRQSPVEHVPDERATVVVRDDEPAESLQAISSDTAQAIICALRSEPLTASAIAKAVDTTIQNVRYHLDRLSEAGLIEAVETWYSEKGREMTVYALTTEELVVQFGPCDTTDC